MTHLHSGSTPEVDKSAFPAIRRKFQNRDNILTTIKKQAFCKDGNDLMRKNTSNFEYLYFVCQRDFLNLCHCNSSDNWMAYFKASLLQRNVTFGHSFVK